MLSASSDPYTEDQEDVNFSWRPQAGPQTAFVHCPVEEILYGGARGGGKTDAALGKLLIMAERYGKNFTGIFFRRELTQLDGVIARSKEIYTLHDAEWLEAKKTWKFKNGAKILMRHLERDSDAEKYQGWNVQCIVFEELTNFPNPGPVMKLKGILRSAHGVPCQMIATANPGGPGHAWVKARYIDPSPLGYKIIGEEVDTLDPKTNELIKKSVYRTFIPSKVTDNKKLVESDPGYVGRLAQTGSEQLVKAWLTGDWNIVDGAYFPEFSVPKHVIRSTSPPDWWMRFRCGDWGSASPFAIYWVAVASEAWNSPCGKLIPKGALVFYREWYGCDEDNAGNFIPNKGCRMFAEEVGAGVAKREKGDPKITYGVLDPSAFAQDGGYSIAERIFRGSRQVRGKVMFRRGDNSRTSGWDTIRARLVGEEHEMHGDKHPMIYFMDCCPHIIRTLPMLQHDEKNPEDCDTDGEDHAPDAVRYGCMSRPYAAKTPAKAKKMTDITHVTMNDVWKTATHQAPRHRI